MIKSLLPENAETVGISAEAHASNQRLADALAQTANFTDILPILLDALRAGGAKALAEVSDLIGKVEAKAAGHGQKLARELAAQGAHVPMPAPETEPTHLSGGPDGGAVHVDSYTQDRDGTPTDVTSHTRSAPGTGGGTMRRKDVGPGKFYSSNGDDYYKSDGKVAQGRTAPVMSSPVKEGKMRGGGAGHFNARRHGQHGYYQHGGVDVLAEPGSESTATVDGTITAIGTSTVNKEPVKEYKYVEITTSDGYKVRQHYVQPSVTEGDKVIAGQTSIGAVDDLGAKYGADMPNHTHLEVYDTNLVVDNGRTDIKRFKRIDPAPLMGW